MENDLAFRWDVHSPLFLRQRLEATFYYGFSSSLQWRVRLEPRHRRMNIFLFYLDLTAVLPDEQNVVLVPLVRVDFWENKKPVADKIRENFFFEMRNRHTFHFEVEIEISPKQVKPYLTIEVQIRLKEGPDPQVARFTITAFDQARLSQDLYRILNDQRYSNMRLLPKGHLEPFHVHSYMIDARWNNFFDEHNLWKIDFLHLQRTVETDISNGLLSDILVYMYSGVLPSKWPDWKDPAFATELFQVIERYKLHHLYQVFVKSDSHQLQVIQNDVFVRSLSFRLDDDNGKLLEGRSQTWIQDDDSPYMFDFRIEISRSDDGPCVSYNLRSRTPYPTQARVNLEFVKHVVDRQTRAVLEHGTLSVDVSDYDLELSGVVSSEPLPFVGDDPIFEDFDPEERRDWGGFEIWHYIQCYVNLSVGLAVVQIKNVQEELLQVDRERFDILADHMHALMNQPIEEDLRIICPVRSDMPGVVKCDHRLHKAIFATRVPAYWRVLRNVARGGDLPDIVNCPFQSEAFDALLLYIYTGRVSAFPVPFAREMYEFAQRSEFDALRNMIEYSGVFNYNP